MVYLAFLTVLLKSDSRLLFPVFRYSPMDELHCEKLPLRSSMDE